MDQAVQHETEYCPCVRDTESAMRVAIATTHGQVVVGDAVAGGLAADAQEDRAAGGAVVVEELEVALLELPVVLKRKAAARWPA